MGKRADRIERLQRRANILGSRISAGTCTKLDEEKAELSALEWAIKELAAAMAHNVSFEKWLSYQPWIGGQVEGQKWYTESSMRAAWEAGHTMNSGGNK